MNSDQLYLDAWGSLLRVHAEVVARVERDLKETDDISLTWFDVLLVLSDAPDKRLRMGDLAAGIVLSKSALTRSVDRLETEGYLKREKCPDDDRVFYAVLLPKGAAALAKARVIYREGIRRYFADGLTKRELNDLDGSLSKVAARFRQPATPAP